MEEATKTVSELVEKYAEEIARAIRDAAPGIWRACLLDAWGGYIVAAIVLMASSIICLGIAAWCEREYKGKKDSYDASPWASGRAFTHILAALCAAGMIVVIVSGFFHAPFAAVSNVAVLIKP